MTTATKHTPATPLPIGARFDGIASKWGKDAAMERAIAFQCSLVIGRDFLEPVEAFEARCPQLQEIKKWIAANK